MRHRIAHRKLGRPTAHRMALLRNQVTSLIKHNSIMTTLHKAKEVKPLADQMVTLAKRGDLHARRQMLSFIYEPQMVRKAFNDFPVRFAQRQGGYTRIVPLVLPRTGDHAKLAIIEYLDKEKAPVDADELEIARQQKELDKGLEELQSLMEKMDMEEQEKQKKAE